MTCMYVVVMSLVVFVADAQNNRQARDVATQTDVNTLRGMFVQTRSEVEQLQTSLGTKIDQLVAAVNELKTSSQSSAVSFKKSFPIFQVIASTGHYKLSLSQARSKCIEQGAVLATMAQLKVANAEGMDWCSCGWVEDGYAAFPQLYPKSGCFADQHNYGSGVRVKCDWQSTWNGWCFDQSKITTYLVSK